MELIFYTASSGGHVKLSVMGYYHSLGSSGHIISHSIWWFLIKRKKMHTVHTEVINVYQKLFRTDVSANPACSS